MPRDPEIRYTGEFAKLVGEVSHALRKDTHEHHLCRAGRLRDVRAHGIHPRPAERHGPDAAAWPRQGRPRADSAAPPLGVLAVLVGIWYLIAGVLTATGKGFLLPMPHEMFTKGFFDPQVSVDIWTALFRTTGVALTGLAVAMVIGIGWAVAMSLARWVERSTYAYAVILQCIPILALVPLVGFWFGYEFTARVIVCILIALFPMVSNTLFAFSRWTSRSASCSACRRRTSGPCSPSSPSPPRSRRSSSACAPRPGSR